MKRIAGWPLLLILITLTNCDRNMVYEGKKDFPERYWVFNNPATFDFEITDADQQYDLLVNVRNSTGILKKRSLM